MRARRLRVHRHEPVGGGVSELGVEAGGGRDVRARGGCGRAGGLMGTRPCDAPGGQSINKRALCKKTLTKFPLQSESKVQRVQD